MSAVTKRQAEQVLAAVRRTFAGYCDPERPEAGPTLVMDADLGWGPRPTILWEEGPYEWTFRFPGGGVDEELTIMMQEFKPGAIAHTKPAQLPVGVRTEATTSYALALYREDS
jgi:hypothetical protein